MYNHIIIPSRERAQWLRTRKHTTLDFVKSMKPTFMVRDDDTGLNEYYQYARTRGVEPLLYDARGILGAAQTYDLIIEQSIKAGCERIIILDDDLKFSMRNPVLNAKPDYKFTTPRELCILLSHAVRLVREELPMLSFTPIMARTQPALLSFCKPMMMAYAIYVPHFLDHPSHRFWQGKDIEARCDLNLSLMLLTQGYLTAFMCSLFIPDNVNNPGGCSTYRDLECERASVRYLKQQYPEYVRTRKKRGWINDPDVIRDTPMVSWKRAFNHPLFKRRFGVSAVTFANKLIAKYETVYEDFIKELRRDTKKPDALD